MPFIFTSSYIIPIRMNISKRFSFSALRKPVGASTSDLISGATQSSVRWRGKSYVAAAAQEPSDLPKRRRGRIPLEERKAVVECYVNKYRAINPGKFPTPSEAKRQVGGSYYVIRKLIQELQHQANISPMSKVETQDEVIKEGKLLPGPHHLSISNMKIHKNIHQDGQATEARDHNLSLKEAGTISSVKLSSVVQVQEEKTIQRDIQASPEMESPKNDESLAGTISSVKLPSVVQVQEETMVQRDMQASPEIESPKNDGSLADTIPSVKLPSAVQVQEENTVQRDIQASPEIESLKNDESLQELKDKLKVEATDFQQQLHNSEYNAKMQDLEFEKIEPEQLHQTQKLGTVTWDSPIHHLDDAEVVKKSNMWDDLKSFADGVFSFFRKR